jgi:hypothetical protein
MSKIFQIETSALFDDEQHIINHTKRRTDRTLEQTEDTIETKETTAIPSKLRTYAAYNLLTRCQMDIVRRCRPLDVAGEDLCASLRSRFNKRVDEA